MFARALLFVPFLLGASAAANATVRCVSDINTLATALDDANNVGAEGTTWDIRLQAKTYLLTSDLVFNPPGDKDNKTFYLSGGWNAGCTKQTFNASATVLRGTASTASTAGTLFMFDGDNARVEISWLRFEQFGQWSIGDKQCTLGNICPGTDAIIVEHNEFHDGENVTTRIFDAKRLVIRGNLFDHIYDLGHFNGPVDILIANHEDVQLTFNTFANLQCLDVPGAIEFRTLNPDIAWHHNIMRSICQYDAYIGAYVNAQPLNPWYNLYLHLGPGFSGVPAAQGNVITVDPKFINPNTGNYHLQSISPAVNAGQTLIGAVSSGMLISTQDLDGNLRPFGQHFDIGAYESFVNDGAPIVWKVTNTSDDDIAGSLRRAINNSNAQVNAGEQHIVFDITTGACPHVILLKNSLPDITHSVWIDGYSQPGSHRNGAQTGSTATVCVAVAPNTTNITHALAVPAAGNSNVQLVLEGLGFGGGFFVFDDTAVDLKSGNYHFVRGNVFGGALPSNGGGLGSLPNAVRIHGSAVFVTVGGSDPADRNYFGTLSGSAVLIEDSGPIGILIDNNYIGVTPDALSAQQIDAYGIGGFASYATQVSNNTIVATYIPVLMTTPAVQGWKVQGNRIGVSPYGSTQAQFRNGFGVFVSTGASQNYIGAMPGEQLSVGQTSNDIRNNNNSGVYITGNGVGNTIRGNRLAANNGPGIQLGNFWNLPNDAGDPDGGPNLFQNYPNLKGSVPAGATRTITALLNAEPNQQYRIDFYRSVSCPDKANANADLYVGSVDADSDANGVVRVTAQISAAGAPEFLTASATSLSSGNTGKLAPCLDEDTIFRDDLEL